MGFVVPHVLEHLDGHPAVKLAGSSSSWLTSWVTAATDTKVYDGTTASSQSVTNVGGLVAGDSLTGLTQAYNSSQVQGTNGSLLIVNSNGVSVGGSVGSTLGDYAITYANTAGTITPRSLAIDLNNITRVTTAPTWPTPTAASLAPPRARSVWFPTRRDP